MRRKKQPQTDITSTKQALSKLKDQDSDFVLKIPQGTVFQTSDGYRYFIDMHGNIVYKTSEGVEKVRV